MKKTGGFLVFIGLVVFILPFFGLQLRLLSLLGKSSQGVGIAIAVIGIIMMIVEHVTEASSRRYDRNNSTKMNANRECPNCHNTNLTTMDKACPKCKKVLPPVQYKPVI